MRFYDPKCEWLKERGRGTFRFNDERDGSANSLDIYDINPLLITATGNVAFFIIFSLSEISQKIRLRFKKETLRQQRKAYYDATY